MQSRSVFRWLVERKFQLLLVSILLLVAVYPFIRDAVETRLLFDILRTLVFGAALLVTLFTVGYGDITPATDSARGIAVVEAILGQFYLAALVAELIGKRVSQALMTR